MKAHKPTKLPILHRVVEICRRPYCHVAGIRLFPLTSPRALHGERTFSQTTAAALGERGVFEEGAVKARGERPMARLFRCLGTTGANGT